MPRIHQYWVYLITNKGRSTVYIGFTNNLHRRIFEHRTGRDPNGFAWRYQCWTLIHFEPFKYVKQGLAREKQTEELEARVEGSPHRKREPHLVRPQHRLGLHRLV